MHTRQESMSVSRHNNVVACSVGRHCCLAMMQAWVLGALQSEAPRPYYWAAALYTLPLLRNGLDQDWFSWTLLLLGVAHVQVCATYCAYMLKAAACCRQHCQHLRQVCLHSMQWLPDVTTVVLFTTHSVQGLCSYADPPGWCQETGVTALSCCSWYNGTAAAV
jgi:hypothetical protein